MQIYVPVLSTLLVKLCLVVMKEPSASAELTIKMAAIKAKSRLGLLPMGAQICGAKTSFKPKKLREI